MILNGGAIPRVFIDHMFNRGEYKEAFLTHSQAHGAINRDRCRRRWVAAGRCRIKC